jgi:hypothetical protein
MSPNEFEAKYHDIPQLCVHILWGSSTIIQADKWSFPYGLYFSLFPLLALVYYVFYKG